MADFILFMHDDVPAGAPEGDWEGYFGALRAAGVFEGGSAIGGGECATKVGAAPPITPRLTGFIRVRADDLAGARRWLEGNPVYEAGGTVEIRELPRS